MSTEEQGKLARILESDAKPESLFFRRNGALAVSANTLLCHLAILTGIRRGEIAGLQFADVDEDRWVIHVRRSVSESDRRVFLKPPKSERGLRQIDVDDHSLCLIARHKEVVEAHRDTLGAQWNHEGWLFASAEGAVLAPRALNA